MRTLNDYFVTTKLADVSTAGSAYVGVPDGGEVIKIITVLHGAITIANATLTPKINGTAITGGALTIAFTGSAAGTVTTSLPTGANTVQEGDALEIATNGGSTGTQPIDVTFVIRRATK